ncbi:adult cuticle protein 1-like [Condylostylus longicornis]|uniref:adult cuticle protein 1-like n=1 Tax=Condylostylus longicornis TaxID=2530218 RepID=UPI00244DF5A5|nr:adult cuticle protein 1-like [Condylostylus longicornis]
MKFAIVVVMLALALGAQGSAIPWAAHGWGAWDDGWHGGPYDGHWGGPWGHHAAVITPGIALSQGPHGHWAGHHGHASVAVHAPVHGHGHDGHYVAKTLGAVHTAPLAGHVASVSSVNVAPAPGTHH